MVFSTHLAVVNDKPNYVSNSVVNTNSNSGEKYFFINEKSSKETVAHYLIDKVKTVYNWFWGQLHESQLGATALYQTESRSGEKRSCQQTALAVSQKQYFVDNSEAKWDKISLCTFGNNGILAGATLPGSSVTYPNAQRIVLFTINNSALQKLDLLSAAISAQMPPRQGENNIASACGDRYFHVITEDPLQGIFHTAVANETLVTPQYIAAAYAALNITSKGYAPRPIKLLGNGCAFAPAYGSTYYFSYTNATGKFDSSGWNMDTFTTSQPVPVETLSFASGTSSVLENTGNNRRLYVPSFSQSSTPIGTNIIDFNNQTIDQSIVNQFYGAKTPTLYGKPITLIAPANNYTTSAIVTAILSQRLMTSSRVLAPNSGIGKGGAMNMANCADFPDIYAYARDALDAGSNYVIMYDVVNATLNSSSIIGGEQIYNNFNLSTSAKPQIGCFFNGTIIIAYLENGQPAFFTFPFLTSNPPSPAANPPSAPSDLFIRITLPINLGQTPILVTPEIIMIGNRTETIKVVDLNHYQFFYPNGSLVNEGAILPRNDLYSLTLSQGNATRGSFPVLEACDAQGTCQTSIADGYKLLFTGGGSNALLIGLTTAAAFLITTITTALLYRNCIHRIAPFRNRLKAGLSENDKGEPDYHQMPK